MLITSVPAASSLATHTQDIVVGSSSPPWHLLYKNELIFLVTYFGSYELYEKKKEWRLASLAIGRQVFKCVICGPALNHAKSN